MRAAVARMGQRQMRHLIGAILGVAMAVMPALAQQTDSAKITFGGLKGDPNQPVTVTSRALTVDEEKGTALFEGDVLVVQGQMRLSAQLVRAFYDNKAAKIEKLVAEGDVILVNAEDAAMGERAEYLVSKGLVTMLGDVTLTQGAATFTAARLIADLTTGLGQLEGGVTSTFTPAAAP